MSSFVILAAAVFEISCGKKQSIHDNPATVDSNFAPVLSTGGLDET